MITNQCTWLITLLAVIFVLVLIINVRTQEQSTTTQTTVQQPLLTSTRRPLGQVPQSSQPQREAPSIIVREIEVDAVLDSLGQEIPGHTRDDILGYKLYNNMIFKTPFITYKESEADKYLDCLNACTVDDKCIGSEYNKVDEKCKHLITSDRFTRQTDIYKTTSSSTNTHLKDEYTGRVKDFIDLYELHENKKFKTPGNIETKPATTINQIEECSRICAEDELEEVYNTKCMGFKHNETENSCTYYISDSPISDNQIESIEDDTGSNLFISKKIKPVPPIDIYAKMDKTSVFYEFPSKTITQSKKEDEIVLKYEVSAYERDPDKFYNGDLIVDREGKINDSNYDTLLGKCNSKCLYDLDDCYGFVVNGDECYFIRGTTVGPEGIVFDSSYLTLPSNELSVITSSDPESRYETFIKGDKESIKIVDARRELNDGSFADLADGLNLTMNEMLLGYFEAGAAIGAGLQKGFDTAVDTVKGAPGNAWETVRGWFSDRKLKKNIVTLANTPRLRVYKFEWNDTAKSLYGLNGSSVGFMADEVETMFPECVTYNKNGHALVNYDELYKILSSTK